MGTALPGHARTTSWYGASNAVAAAGQSVCNSSNPCYYTPAALQTAYALAGITNGNNGAGITIAVVDAYYDPQILTNLNAFIAQYHLPPCNNCLTVVNEFGGTNLPTTVNQPYALEANLDVQMAYAVAPGAHILLVCATTSGLSDLLTGVLYAQKNADVVTNSYGIGSEVSNETAYDSNFSSSPVPILFSSGDSGSELQYPCVSAYVTCVGGTNLTSSASGYRTVESAWSNGGGGCSQYVASQAYQNGFSKCGTTRGVPDVAALGDPNTGFTVYLGTNASGGGAGIYVIGGTSVGTPLVAGIVALIDAARVYNSKSKLGSDLNTLLYGAAAAPYYDYRFYDVTTGSNGHPAGVGWDEATGLGVVLGPSLANYLVSLP